MKLMKLQEYLKWLGIAEPEGTAGLLLDFMRLVLEKNEDINLTAITEEGEFVEKHLMDSLTCYGWPEIESASRVVDVGTGAGFPGLPLALLYPEKEFLLMDSLGKRISFLREAAAALGIRNVECLHSRAEDAGRDPTRRERYDLCLCRAVGHLGILSEYCLPLVRKGGVFYAYKTVGAAPEIDQSLQARLLLGASSTVETRLCPIGGAGADETGNAAKKAGQYAHTIMVIRKERPTPRTYPRKAGTPARVPL
ncbi:MAG: 16S rRNA (guanine(527)-N(7))-methyltransferase RsmG [Clostridiales Family XIII bacterium]|jgi:16S rRNA (guanine527-N7)-methyltransferase|nr:16S rRNA (guanine(527)-N(7))-methyltransferase RsmG [Clostridiales Family XIII bacterium]